MEMDPGHIVTDLLQKAGPSKPEADFGSEVMDMHTLCAGWAFIYSRILRE